MGWIEFTIAFAVFFLSHSLPVRSPLWPMLDRMLGRRGFTIAYSLLSLGVLTWLIVAAGRAPYVPLWNWAPWQSHLALILMAVACVILAMALGRPNPFSFGGMRNEAFDPQRPGIVRLTRHPLLLALALWSLAHLIANGDVAHVLLFGVFAAFAAFGGRLVERRKRRGLGQNWEQRIAEVRHQPIRRVFSAKHRNDTFRILGAGFLFVGLLWLHPYVIGVSPIP
ncbi:MAG: NnrU family protein [Tateyamaria sp.]|uniref:NnrU family protein n=1 Tax=Tateyamaria sp. TaxID=1929288 RepID=UPI0032DC2801